MGSAICVIPIFKLEFWKRFVQFLEKRSDWGYAGIFEEETLGASYHTFIFSQASFQYKLLLPASLTVPVILYRGAQSYYLCLEDVVMDLQALIDAAQTCFKLEDKKMNSIPVFPLL